MDVLFAMRNMERNKILEISEFRTRKKESAFHPTGFFTERHKDLLFLEHLTYFKTNFTSPLR
jgi:hypothetical protein